MAVFERWTRAVIPFRIFVLAFWFAVTIVGTLCAVRLPALLSISLVIPGTSSEQADTIPARHFAENPEGTYTVVFRMAQLGR
jgi:uncharacterized membrane protein YdfJ with MMPL/SSD domain